jgi:mannose-1-phosphate guanylyltransferase
MKVLLLAAGFGTRLWPITKNIPKCLVPICGVPLLKIWIDKCLLYGIDQIYINTHYLSDKVNLFIKENYDDVAKKKIIILNEKKLLGTAGTIKNNINYFLDESLIVIHADNFSIFDFQDLVKSHLNRHKDTEITMMTFKTDSPETCGIVELNSQNVVTNFYEKILNPPSNLANAAVYIFEKSVVEYISKIKKSEIDISLDVLPHFLYKISTFYNNIYHRDIGNIESYKQSQIDCKKFTY